MSVTIIEALQNAHFNLCVQKIPGLSDRIGAGQLNNAVTLLNKGYSLEDEVEPLLDQYGEVENVPEKTNA